MWAWFRVVPRQDPPPGEYSKHPRNFHIDCIIRHYGCIWWYFTDLNTLMCTSWGEYYHPRVSSSEAQNAAIRGSGVTGRLPYAFSHGVTVIRVSSLKHRGGERSSTLYTRAHHTRRKASKAPTEETVRLVKLQLKVARADYSRVLSILTPSLDRAARLPSSPMPR